MSPYLVRLKIFEWTKRLRRLFRQFIKTAAREFTAHYACKNAKMNLKSTTTTGIQLSNNNFIHGIMGEGGGGGGTVVSLSWLDCKNMFED